jgi:hypothetical protein
VPILEAINITRETAGNEVYARALGNVHDEIREGESFANPLRTAKVCDAIVINMIDVGEETGELDKMLIKIADNYDEEVEALVGGLVSLLEPVMVVVLGDTTASNLFGDSTLAVGQSIRINGQSFRVIGVLASRANALIVTNDPAIDRVYLHRKTPRGLLRTFRQIREQNTMSSSTS